MIVMDTSYPTCERCGAHISGHMLGWFSHEALCLLCYSDEKRHPEYMLAYYRWRNAHHYGDLDFPGLGVPPELRAAGAFRRAIREAAAQPESFIRNTTPFRTAEVATLVLWVSGQLGIALPDTPVIVRAQRSDARRGPASGNYRLDGTITIRLGVGSAFPYRYHNHGLQSCKPFAMETWQEAVVYMVAHELTHKRQHACNTELSSQRFDEVDADQAGQAVLAIYRVVAPLIDETGREGLHTKAAL